MAWTPESAGCRCWECPLAERRLGGVAVPPEFHPNPLALLVGEAPGKDEVREQRPFIGASGIELTRCLQAIGVPRTRVAISNALLCAPPDAHDGGLAKLLHRIQQTNKKRDRAGLPRLPTPMDCCRPRLLAELAAVPNVIPLGNIALAAVTGHTGSIVAVRGGPRNVTVGDGDQLLSLRVLPTLHPAFVLRQRRWQFAFRADLARAFRWFRSGLAWRDPIRLERPSPAQLRAWLEAARGQPFTTCDLETFAGFPEVEHYDPLHDRIGVVGIGTADGSRTVVVPFRSLEGASFYTSWEQAEIAAIVRDYFSSGKWPIAWHNGNYYDLMVIEARLGIRVTTKRVDMIALHKLAEPELPHGLGYVGSVHTDVSAWKEGHLATEAETDRAWWEYNAKDLAVTALALPSVNAAVTARGQAHLVPTVQKLQAVCVGLHRNGMHVDEARRLEWDAKLIKEARDALTNCRKHANRPHLNPGSTMQLRDLLFDELQIPIHGYTDLGDPSTNDDALRAFLSETWGQSEAVRRLVQAIRTYRKKIKMRGTYVTKLRDIRHVAIPEPILAWDEEETEKERERRLKKKAPSCGLRLPDGRVHPDFNAHGTVGWRLSSSNPNAQNFPNLLRDMIIPAPGRCFVGCDEAQLELRMVAGLARAAYYLEQFNRGEDPHLALCEDFFGATFKAASKDQKKALRRFVKEFTYASLYLAGPETIQQVLTSSEDEAGALLYPDLTIRETAAFHDKWLRRNPEIEQWWTDTINEWRQQRYLTDPIFGLRVDFLDGEEPNKLVNFKPQSGGAALVHIATFRFLEEVPFEKWGPGTGLVGQAHDQLVAEVPADHPGPEILVRDAKGKVIERKWCKDPKCRCTAARTAKLLEECMTLHGKKWGLDLPFFGEAAIGMNWKEV